MEKDEWMNQWMNEESFESGWNFSMHWNLVIRKFALN